jgi:5-methylcytosine-specific restriction endonuclease McrA
VKERTSAYYKNNKEKAVKSHRERREKDREKDNAYNRKWKRNNKESVLTSQRNRRATKRMADGRHTKEDINFLYTAQKGCCAACKSALIKSYHVDHVQPLVDGGSNDRYNLQLLCPPCNLRKHVKSQTEFMQLMGYLL